MKFFAFLAWYVQEKCCWIKWNSSCDFFPIRVTLYEFLNSFIWFATLIKNISFNNFMTESWKNYSYCSMTHLLWFLLNICLPSTILILYTDLGSLIGNTQCGNFRIFLPLRFYVKSTLVILNAQKNCHFDHLSSSEF